jgi:calcium permeable stress-gated cation channel
MALKIAFGWSIIALGGALPLYLINIPCNTDFPTPAVSGQGGYSTLSDISLIRLLRAFDNGNAVSKDLIGRVSLPDGDGPFHVRVRVIVLTILTILLGLLPALIVVIKEFNTIVAYRQRWLQFRCQRKDLGWLSARKAPGFATWGERQFKDYLVKIGLSSTLTDAVKHNGNTHRSHARNGEKRTRRREEEQPLNLYDDIDAEIDVQSLFSIG